MSITCHDEDGKTVEKMYQWSVGAKVIISGLTTTREVTFHFWNAFCKEAIVITPELIGSDYIASVPESLPQKPVPITLHVYQATDGYGFRTVFTTHIGVTPRPKPLDPGPAPRFVYLISEYGDYISSSSKADSIPAKGGTVVSERGIFESAQADNVIPGVGVASSRDLIRQSVYPESFPGATRCSPGEIALSASVKAQGKRGYSGHAQSPVLDNESYGSGVVGYGAKAQSQVVDSEVVGREGYGKASKINAPLLSHLLAAHGADGLTSPSDALAGPQSSASFSSGPGENGFASDGNAISTSAYQSSGPGRFGFSNNRGLISQSSYQSSGPGNDGATENRGMLSVSNSGTLVTDPHCGTTSGSVALSSDGVPVSVAPESTEAACAIGMCGSALASHTTPSRYVKYQSGAAFVSEVSQEVVSDYARAKSAFLVAQVNGADHGYVELNLGSVSGGGTPLTIDWGDGAQTQAYSNTTYVTHSYYSTDGKTEWLITIWFGGITDLRWYPGSIIFRFTDQRNSEIGVKKAWLGNEISSAAYLAPRSADTKFLEMFEYLDLGTTITSLSDSFMMGVTGLKYIVIPSQVARIGARAFEGCSRLTRVTISGAPSIGNYFLRSCTNLESVTCLSATPPSLSSVSITSWPAATSIYVPAEAVETYKTASYWSARAAYILPIA